MSLRPEHSLDVLNKRSVGRLPGLVGIRFTAIGEDAIAAELDIRPDLIAPNGYLHAATVIALADTACGYGCLAHLPTAQRYSRRWSSSPTSWVPRRKARLLVSRVLRTWAARRRSGTRSSRQRRRARPSHCFAARNS